MSCGKILGGNGIYRCICGRFWCGSIAQCDDCEEKELRKRVLEKQERLLDKQLKESHQ